MSGKVCPKCKSSFQCASPVPGCWCEEQRLNGETLQYLRENYDNCLCPDCLKGFEEAQKNPCQNQEN